MSDYSNPAIGGVTVTKHDSTNIAFPTGSAGRGLWVGGAGNVAFVGYNDSVVTIIGVPAGTLLPIQVKRVNSTNTTATNMVAFY